MKLFENSTFSARQMNGSIIAFVLITACFVLWGFTNSVTTPMVGAFSKIFRMNTTEATMVPVAYYLGYFCMAFPAALFIQRYTFKLGVIVGLGIFAIGALMFLPAKSIGEFSPFLFAYFVLTCGLSFLETTCTPYVYTMGNEEQGIMRLNAAQAFNALGSIAGMLVATSMHSNFSPVSTTIRHQLPEKEFEIIKAHDLNIVIEPYIFITAIVVLMIVVIWVNKNRFPKFNITDSDKGFTTIIKELIARKNYREGVIAEFCYLGAQVGCWTYITLYGSRIFMAEGMTEQAAEMLSQEYNILAIVFFACSRFICTWLLKWFAPERLLTTMAILGLTALIGVILFTDRNGIYCLVAVSISMSLMFPTIYGLAVKGIGENIKIAGAGLIMAVTGGGFFPLFQAVIIQSNITIFGLPCTNLSFIIPLFCLAVVVWYGHRAYVRHAIQGITE